MTANSNLRLSLNAKFIIAFIFLRHIFHEAHEFAHMIAARLFTGVWGTRDFNNVQPFAANTAATEAESASVAFAGPMFNYIFCWMGAIIIARATSLKQKALGAVIIFACLPFARVFTAVVGGGDELGVCKTWFSDPTVARIFAIALVTVLLVYPVYAAIKTLPKQYRILTGIGFLLLPMFLEGLVVLGLFNKILRTGFLNEPQYFGAPLFVICVLAVSVLLFMMFSGSITSFLQPKITVNKMFSVEEPVS